MYEIPKVVRFKKRAYQGENSKGDVPKWHIAAQPYKKGEMYRRYRALCGYVIEWPDFSRSEVMLSVAKRPRGEHCQKCLKKAS